MLLCFKWACYVLNGPVIFYNAYHGTFITVYVFVFNLIYDNLRATYLLAPEEIS